MSETALEGGLSDDSTGICNTGHVPLDRYQSNLCKMQIATALPG